MNHMLRALLLSTFLVSAAQVYSFDWHTSAINQRAYFKQQLDQGRMVNSSDVVMIREGVYLLKGNYYLTDEVYEVGSTISKYNAPDQAAVFFGVAACIVVVAALEVMFFNTRIPSFYYYSNQ